MGYKIDKVPLWYIESLMSKNFYADIPDLEYSEFLLLIVRFSVEFKFDLVKTIPKMLKAQQKPTSMYSKMGLGNIIKTKWLLKYNILK